MEARKAKIDKANALAQKDDLRDENIKKRMMARDLKLVEKLEAQKASEQEHKVELEAVKMQKRLQEKERAQKHQEELEHKRQEWERLEKLRADNIAKKEADWKKREQTRIDGGTKEGEAPKPSS